MLRWLMLAIVIALYFFLNSPTLSLAQESPYKLPYPAGTEYTVRQGNFGSFSHSRQHYRGYGIYAFDFTLADGNPVVASRAGTVLIVKDNSNIGGCNENYIGYANYLIIDHGDGTSALYLHLQYNSVTVEENEWVEQGQRIARADSTGYVCGAHLHFQIQETPRNRRYWYTQSIQTSFSDKDVLAKEPDGIPKEGKSYISDNAPPLAACPPQDGPKFVVGQEVITTDDLKVRENPGLNSREIKTEPRGTSGTVLEGPACQDDFIWWKVKYQDGTIGWSAQDWLNIAKVLAKKIAYIGFSDGQLYVVNSDGTNLRKLTTDKSVQMFDWLPDGKRILYYDFDGHTVSNVYLIEVDTGKEEKILQGKSFDKLSPDGKKFLYWESDYPNQTLAIFNLENRSSRLLPVQQTYTRLELGVLLGVTSLTWSPDSKKIAYIDENFFDPQTRMRGTAVWIVNLETLEKQKIWENTLGAVGNPISLSWSPDGSKIGFARTLVRQGLGILTYDLLKIDLGSLQTVLDITYESRFCGGVLPGLMDIHWTQESAKVVLSFPEGCWRLISSLFEVEPTLSRPGLWLFEEGKEPKFLSELTAYSYIGIDFSPDGNFVVFTTSYALYTINIDGSNLKKIAEGGNQPKISPK